MCKMSQRTAIGIDLGTTYSCVAWLDQHDRIEIIPNEQGYNITPSCVAFDETEVTVGEGAKDQIYRNPTNTIFDPGSLVARATARRWSTPLSLTTSGDRELMLLIVNSTHLRMNSSSVPAIVAFARPCFVREKNIGVVVLW
ncbi:heat shock protein 70 family, peptide-binding domain protein [Tanacetum coccineum]